VQPYYEHDGSTVYHADCRDVLPTLAAQSVDLILTDPPYYRVKAESWDRQWPDAEAFLAWLRDLFGEWRRILKPNGSVLVFAGPDLAARVECALADYFHVLNSIRWVKEDGWHKKADEEALRSFLSPWEALLFAEQYGDQYEDAAKALHLNVYAPIGRAVQTKREAAGLKRWQVDEACAPSRKPTGLCYRWEAGDCLPTREQYITFARLCGDGREYEALRREYEALRREYEALRRPFAARDGMLSADTWRFPTVLPHYGKHPCEKPLLLLEYAIEATTRPGALVLDACAGSGSTLRAAKNVGRQSIGIELDERWCRQMIGRLAQGVLFTEAG
jgi:adenine-specific DNA-methyltransferase